ncbi:hypothetical protein GCM10023068_10080 [Leifsonia shinshuensis]
MVTGTTTTPRNDDNEKPAADAKGRQNPADRPRPAVDAGRGTSRIPRDGLTGTHRRHRCTACARGLS